MRYIKWISVLVCLLSAFYLGFFFGNRMCNKEWVRFISNKIVCDIPKGSILITKKDGDFLVARIADKATKDGLLERFKNNQEIEVLK